MPYCPRVCPPLQMSNSEVAASEPAAPGSLPIGQAAQAQSSSNPAGGVHLARGTERKPKAALDENSNVSPVQVIEAALFVGGGP